MNETVELVFILDKSGSMAGLESDTIGGFNALLNQQKRKEGQAYVTTVLFNHDSELLHDRISVNGVSPITEKEYEVGGTTALLDAIGATIQKIANVQKRTAEEHRAGKVMVVITTDGMENASHEFNEQKVKTLIRHQKEQFGWEFIFLGANIDAVTTASQFGIDEEFAVNYHADSEGTELNYQVLNDTVSSFRSGKSLKRDWKKEIEKDFIRRQKN